MSAKPAYWPRKLSAKQGRLPVYVTPHKKRQAAKATESKSRAKRREQRRKGVRVPNIGQQLPSDLVIDGAIERVGRGPFDHKKMEGRP